MHGTRPVGPRSGGLAEKKTARALLGHRSLVSVVMSMPNLEEFACLKFDRERNPSIKDLSPLSSCPMLKRLYVWGNRELKDLSPLSTLQNLGDPLLWHPS